MINPFKPSDIVSLPGEFFGRESGTATYAKVVLTTPVCHSLRFSATRGQYAILNVDGICVFGAAADTFDDVVGLTDAPGAPTLTHPQRQWRPKTALHGAQARLWLTGNGCHGRDRGRHHRMRHLAAHAFHAGGDGHASGPDSTHVTACVDGGDVFVRAGP